MSKDKPISKDTKKPKRVFVPNPPGLPQSLLPQSLLPPTPNTLRNRKR